MVPSREPRAPPTPDNCQPTSAVTSRGDRWTSRDSARARQRTPRSAAMQLSESDATSLVSRNGPQSHATRSGIPTQRPRTNPPLNGRCEPERTLSLDVMRSLTLIEVRVRRWQYITVARNPYVQRRHEKDVDHHCHQEATDDDNGEGTLRVG